MKIYSSPTPRAPFFLPFTNIFFSVLKSSLRLVSLHHPQILLASKVSKEKKRFCGFAANAENDNNKYSRKKKRKPSWWRKLFLEDDGNWLGLKDDDMVEDVLSDSEKELLGGDKFEAWKRKAEAIIELREAQEDTKNEESRRWEDWIVVADGDDDKLGYANNWVDDGGGGVGGSVGVGEEKGNGLIQSVRDLVLGTWEGR